MARLQKEQFLVAIRTLNRIAAQYQTAIIVVTHGEKIIPRLDCSRRIRDVHDHEEAGICRRSAWDLTAGAGPNLAFESLSDTV